MSNTVLFVSQRIVTWDVNCLTWADSVILQEAISWTAMLINKIFVDINIEKLSLDNAHRFSNIATHLSFINDGQPSFFHDIQFSSLSKICWVQGKTWLILNQKGSQVHFEKETKSRINCNHLFVSTDIQGRSVYYHPYIVSLLVEDFVVTPCNHQINK